MTKIPLLIPVFNNPTYLNNFINQFSEFKTLSLRVLDNGSDFPPMLDLLNNLENNNIEVVKFNKNLGPHFAIKNGTFFDSLPGIFCLSDPDIQISRNLPYDFCEILIQISNKYKVGKVGFAIEVPQEDEFLELHVKLDGQIRNMRHWELQFWEDKIEDSEFQDPLYLNTLDTQFALYNKEFFKTSDRYKAIRVGGRFTSKHLGLYKKRIVPNAELEYYKNTSKYSYYIGNFEEDGSPFIKITPHEYTLLNEKIEGLTREIQRIAKERDHFLSELEKIYKSNSWKILALFRKMRKIFNV